MSLRGYLSIEFVQMNESASIEFPAIKTSTLHNAVCLQDLRAINNMIRINERNQISGKRIMLQDDSAVENPAKRINLSTSGNNALSKKLESIMIDRSAANGM